VKLPLIGEIISNINFNNKIGEITLNTVKSQKNKKQWQN
jgi:hypothetical protein